MNSDKIVIFLSCCRLERISIIPNLHRLLSFLMVLFLLSLSLLGCAQFQDRPLRSAESALRIQTRTLSTGGLREFIESVTGQETNWPFKSWDIDQLTLAAMYYHPDLALARAQAGVADAASITAAQRPNPSLSILPYWIANPQVPGTFPWIVATLINLPIETAGKRQFRIDQAGHHADAARWRIADSAWLVRGRVRVAMLEAYAAQEAERLLQQRLPIQQEMTARQEQQHSAGELTRLEVMRSQLALNQLQLALSAARKRIAESLVMLATAIGVPVDALTEIQLDSTNLSQPPILPATPIQTLKTIAMQARPDVLAALADYEAAQSALQLEIANQYPNIQANPGYAWFEAEHRPAFGANLQLPIMHQNQGPIAQAEATRHELTMRFEALQMRILGDIDRAHASWTAVRAKWLDAEKLRRLQRETLHSMQAMFQAGEIDHLTLLSAELEGLIGEQARLDVLVETQQVFNVLEDTLRYPMGSTFTATFISESAMGNTLP